MRSTEARKQRFILPETWPSPMEVVLNPWLTLAAEHPILMYWAWTEFPMDQAATEEFDVVEFLQ